VSGSGGVLYHQLGTDRFRASELTAGPWAAEAQHGAPVGALLLHRIQQEAGAVSPSFARVTVELLRPVPVTELTVVARVKRPGRRVQMFEAEMFHGDNLVAAATAWSISGNALDVPGAERPVPPPPTASGDGLNVPEFSGRGFHRQAVEIDFVSGHFTEPGPGTVWVRFHAAVVDDHPVSPAQRALVAADFGNGTSSTVSPTETTFINADLTLYLSRTPQSDWIAIDSTTYTGGEGYGFAESVVFDESGVVGRSVQALLFQLRD
jgi:hypothetical protein